MQFRYFFLTILLFLVSEDFGFAQQSTERKWTLPEGTIVHLGDGGINDIAYSPDGELLAVAGVNGIWLYDTGNGQEVARTHRIHATGDSEVLPFLRRGRRWQVAVGEVILLTGRFAVGRCDWHALTVHNYTFNAQGINSVAFSPNSLIVGNFTV